MGPLLRFGDPLYQFRVLDSTMREAADRAQAGAPEGTLILAEEQTAGRGRLGRSWVSTPGAGLYCSLILRPKVSADRSPVLTLAMGLGAARGIGEACGVQCDLRWPNDVLLNQKKCCGVLVEMTAAGDKVDYVLAGIGINVNQAEMPAGLTGIATSLRMETGAEYVREAVLEAVLRNLERYYEVFLERGASAIVDAFSRLSTYAKGKRVMIEGAGPPVTGTTAGLDSKGVLLLRRADGRVEPVLAGSVRPWEPSPATT